MSSSLLEDPRAKSGGIWRRISRSLIAGILGFVAVASVASNSIATAQEGQTLDVPTAAALQEQIDGLQTSEAPNKDELLGIYGQALQELERAETIDQRAIEFVRHVSEAPGLLQSLREELSTAPTGEDPEVLPGESIRDLEQRQQQAEANRAAAQKVVDDLSGESQHRADRMGVLAEEVAGVRTAMSESELALRAAAEDDAVGVARRSLLLAQFYAQSEEVRSLNSERECYEVRRELLPLRRDQAQRHLTRAEQVLEFWQRHVTNLRQLDADQAAREAELQRRQTAKQFPALNEIARRNEELASQRSGDDGVPALMSRADSALFEAQQLRDETARRFAATRRKLAVGGLTEGMGLLLRREYEWTRPLSSLRAASIARRAELSRAQLLRITLQEERDTVGDIATFHQRLMLSLASKSSDDMTEQLSSLAPESPDDTTEQLSSLARELLTSQRALHEALIDELGTLINTLFEHERLHQELLATTTAYRSYIEERILWVPSIVGSVIPSPVDAAQGVAWLTSPSAWSEAVSQSAVAFRQRRFRCGSLIVLILGLAVFRRRIRRSLVGTAEKTRSYRTDRYRLTALALLQTVALALPLPLLLWTIGWLLEAPLEQVEVASLTGAAACVVALSFFTLEFLRQASYSKHLGEAHLRWNAASAKRLRLELGWFLPVALPLEILTIVFDRQSSPAWTDSAGRFAFVALLTALLVILIRLFRPRTSVLAEHYRRSNSKILERTHGLIFALAVAVPTTLIVLALAGYFYSAVQFAGRLRGSIGLGIALFLVNALLLRWLFIARRRLAIEQARQRAQAKAAAARAVAAETTDAAPARETGAAPIDEEAVDIPAVDAQTRQLIRSGVIAAAVLGLFFIWAGAFPALRALDRVQLWPEVVVLDAESASLNEPNGTTVLETDTPNAAATNSDTSVLPSVAMPAEPDSSPPLSISLADALLSLVVLVLTGIATKNAPGLLEIAVLQRLPLDSGSRYALSTLFRYVILIMGITIGFGAIGIGWSKIQWLAAALTFGLAFGLQEIVANFVSGVIILLERQVRVGDIITVGGTEGRVTRLRMRATTILDWDRRELLVPNKEFITGSVVNWTLSDPVTRMIIPVGIAYGSDTKLARELLLKVADANDLVLADPAPTAIFRNFGDSTLDFELRVFLGNRELWPEMIDWLHTHVDLEFRKAGIEVAFPQRDLHIRSMVAPLQADPD